MNDRPHLLIVDDDREIRGLLAQYLEKHEFRTTAVAGRQGDAARVWSARTSTCVVLDLMLPGEDGLSLCRELRGALAGADHHADRPRRGRRSHHRPRARRG